ncbi:MAG: FkbM family methyltransferase [Pseudomonadota bacterium]
MSDPTQEAPLPPFAVLDPLLASVVDVAHEGIGYRFFVANPFDYIQAYHARGEMYEPASLALIAEHFPVGGTFVDIGAHVGNHAIYAAKALGAAKVIAFEPSLKAHTILTVNKALNGLTRFEIRKQALSDAPGEAVIETPAPMHEGRNTLTEDGPGQRVPVVTGDAALEGRKVSFLKIDVEGHEMQVLGGLTKTVREHRPPIFIEVRDGFSAALEAWCERHGYRVAERIRQYQGEENVLLLPAAGT